MNSVQPRPSKVSAFFLTFGSILFALALGELAVRVVVGGKSAYPFSVWPPNIRQIFSVPDDRLPGVSKPTAFTINSAGLRGREFSEEDTQRILAVGGSTTECLYLDDAKTWTRLLEEKLSAGDPKQRWWVGGAGRSGRTAAQHALDLRLLLPQYPKINTVVSIVGVNDLHTRLMYGAQTTYHPTDLRIDEERDRLIDKSFTRDLTPRLIAPFSLGRLVWRAVNQARGQAPKPSDLFQDSTGEVFVRLRKLRSEAVALLPHPDLSLAIKYYRLYLNEMIDQAAQQKVRLILATQPSLWHQKLSPDELKLLWMGGIGDFFSTKSAEYYSVDALEDGLRLYNQVLREVASERGVEWIDLAERIPQSVESFYDDVHFNDGGARRVADEFATYLLAHPQAPGPIKERPTFSVERFTSTQISGLKGWGPQTTAVGTPFLKQPDGSSALWFQFTTPVCDECTISIGGHLLAVSKSTDSLSASIPKSLFDQLFHNPGPLQVWLVDLHREIKQEIGSFNVSAK